MFYKEYVTVYYVFHIRNIHIHIHIHISDTMAFMNQV